MRNSRVKRFRWTPPNPSAQASTSGIISYRWSISQPRVNHINYACVRSWKKQCINIHAQAYIKVVFIKRALPTNLGFVLWVSGVQIHSILIMISHGTFIMWIPCRTVSNYQAYMMIQSTCLFYTAKILKYTCSWIYKLNMFPTVLSFKLLKYTSDQRKR